MLWMHAAMLTAQTHMAQRATYKRSGLGVSSPAGRPNRWCSADGGSTLPGARTSEAEVVSCLVSGRVCKAVAS